MTRSTIFKLIRVMMMALAVIVAFQPVSAMAYPGEQTVNKGKEAYRKGKQTVEDAKKFREGLEETGRFSSHTEAFFGSFGAMDLVGRTEKGRGLTAMLLFFFFFWGYSKAKEKQVVGKAILSYLLARGLSFCWEWFYTSNLSSEGWVTLYYVSFAALPIGIMRNWKLLKEAGEASRAGVLKSYWLFRQKLPPWLKGGPVPAMAGAGAAGAAPATPPQPAQPPATPGGPAPQPGANVPPTQGAPPPQPAVQAPTCPFCQTPILMPGAKFCGECLNPLQATAAPAPQPQPAPTAPGQAQGQTHTVPAKVTNNVDPDAGLDL